MKIWRLLLQSIGVITLLLAAWGCYYWVTTGLSELRHPLRPLPFGAPFLRTALWTMRVINGVFLAAFVFTSVKLLRSRPNAAVIYEWLILALVAYSLLLGVFWILPSGIGISIAAATGIGNVPLGPLVFFPAPFVYPLVSIILVILARRRLQQPEEHAGK